MGEGRKRFSVKNERIFLGTGFPQPHTSMTLVSQDNNPLRFGTAFHSLDFHFVLMLLAHSSSVSRYHVAYVRFSHEKDKNTALGRAKPISF